MTSLKSQARRCTRVRACLVSVLALMAGGFYLLGYRPADHQLQQLTKQMQEKQLALQSDRERAGHLSKVQLDVENLKLRLERYDKRLPKQQELGQFMRDITQLSQQSTLRKLTVQPGVPKRHQLFNELPISLNFEGDFLSVFAFLKETEGMQRLTRVNTINVKCRDTKLGTVEVQLSMNIYFSEG